MARIASLALLALVYALAANASAATINVTQQSLTFNPRTVTAAPGDTVVWHWTSLSHTITSGVNCTPSGLFNMPLTNLTPTQSFTIPVGTQPTTIDYFCSPHCAFNMKGSIIVVAPPPPSPDIDGDGCVGASDLGILLGAWGSGDADADLDQDGIVGAADLSLLLGAWSC
ncbi:MAG: plastocyanin/azurin family copper-binding protein [Phycisphaerales bacterium]